MRRLWLIAVTAGLLVLTACGGGAGSGQGSDGTTAAGHVHGLGVDPADGAVYIATHNGLYRATADRSMAPVGELRRDYMGFTVTGPRTFLASGHPATGEQAPNPLGLVRTRDAGATWTSVALSGQVDFHALDAAGDVVYGYDSAEQRLLASGDGGRSWEARATLSVADIAANPQDSSVLLATGGEGVMISRDGGRSFGSTGPLLAFVSWSPQGAVYGLDPDGVLHTSADGGMRWTALGTVPGGSPRALTAVDDSRVLAATKGGVYESRDGGRTFTALA